MELSTQIALLFPQGREVFVKEEKLVVKVMGIGKFPKIIKLLEPILPSNEKGDGKEFSISYQEFFLNHSDVVIQIMALATNKELSWFDDVSPDEGLELLMAIAEVNVDFFIKRVAEKFNALPSRVSGLLEKK